MTEDLVEPASDEANLTILSQRTCYHGWNLLCEYEVESLGKGHALREVVHRPDLAVVLAYSPQRRTATLVRQLRLAAHLAGSAGLLLEAPSGRVDSGESPFEAARRELGEETGLQVSDLRPLASVFLNPALSVERAHMYACDLDDYLVSHGPPDASDMLGDAQVVEVPLVMLTKPGTLTDAKTALIVSMLKLQKPELFEESST